MARHHLLVVLIFLALATIVYGHLIDGIFTEPTLEPGYNLVATIPTGATNLNVTELRHTSNYLAVRLQDSSFLLNGNYNINWSGVYKAAGTTFVYHRQTHQQLESFAAIGPLQEPIDVMVLYQEPNPGIVYRYVIPGNAKDINPIERINRGHLHGHHGHDVGSSKIKRVESTSTGAEVPISPYKRYRKRKFGWKPSNFTPCSKSCGGGVQTKSHICIREHTQAQVPPKCCHNVEKPPDIQVRCNVGPCPPRWRTGAWSECSVSCGSGIRSRELECVQEVNSQLTVHIADGACAEVSLPAVTEICETSACKKDEIITQSNLPIARWEAREWSECSVTCGPGTKTRKFECTPHNDSCLPEDRPTEEAACDLGPCPVEPEENSVDKPQWLFTEWSRECSVPCGTGIQSRRIICEQLDNESCDAINRPDTTRTCSTDRSCSGQWLVGSWTECSSSCDAGEQTREVVCVTAIHGALRVVLDMNCPAQKPDTRKPCNGPPCPPTWYTSDWSECSRSCGRGVQTRIVKCVNPGSALSASECAIDQPISKRSCNEHLCRHSDHGDDSLQSRIQNDPQVNDGLSADESCQDSITNCALVAQARLCIYPFYSKVCCSSCSARHDIE